MRRPHRLAGAARMTASIRRLHPADAQDYRTIRLAALETDPDAFGASHQDEAARPMAASAERLATSAVFGAYAGGGIVGMAAFKRHDGHKEDHKAFVWGVFVQPAWRGQGVSRALMDALLAAADQTVEHVTLTVAAGNGPAQALYESVGFRTYGVEPRAYKTETGYCAAVLMARLCP